MVLAGTDVSGTSMHGLAQAARSKGLNATGMRLTVDELRHNMIVHVTIDGTPHYSVVKEVTNESVRLADPSLGNIEMSREKFNEIYTGNALVITNPNMEALGVSVNETSNQTNDVSVQSQNSQTLTAETMQSIRGRVIWKGLALSVAASLTQYLLTTPRNRWSWRGVGGAIAWGVALGVVFGRVGIAVAKAVLRKAKRFIPWRWQVRLGL